METPHLAAKAQQSPPSTLRHGAVQGLRVLALVLVLSATVAGFLALTFGDRFLGTWIYSVCVTVCCLGLAHLGLKLRRSRPHWPGWPVMALWSIFVVAPVGYQGGIWLGNLVTGWNAPGLALLGTNPRALLVVLAVTLAVTLGVTAWSWSRARLDSTERDALQAQRQAAEAQLTLLQSQLEPHMLFNTLANLRVLITLDPPRAQAMLDRLIAYLRATLQASRQGSHTLAAEFQRLDDYLALMAVRMGPRLAVQLDLPEALRSVPVPALLLQPLVENAIQHGLEPKVEGGRLSVGARREGNRLVLSVRDTGIGLGALPPPGASASASASTGTGFGTAGVRERLAVLHGTRATLALHPATDAEGGTLATVTLPLADPPTEGAPPDATRPDRRG
jgi:signal transduction histidine kinase